MSSPIEELLQKESQRFEGKFMELEEFNSIMIQIGQLDQRCYLSPDIIQKLFDFVYVKQSGQVTFEAAIGLAGEILKDKMIPQQQDQPINFKAQTESQDILFNRISCFIDNVTGDTLQHMKFIYEACLEESYRQQKDVDIELGILVEDLAFKIAEIVYLSEIEKQNIELLFKCIMSDKGTVTSTALGELMSVLEQFWISNVQGPNRISIQKEEEKLQKKEDQTKQKKEPNKDKDKSKDKSKKTDKKNKEIEEENNFEQANQFLKVDYADESGHAIDYLMKVKGQEKKYYEVLGELTNGVILMNSKLDSYGVMLEEYTKAKEENESTIMRLEQKVSFLESELKKIVDNREADFTSLMEYKEELEQQCDNLLREQDNLESTIRLLQSKLLESDKQASLILKLENQASSSTRNYESLSKKYNQLQIQLSEVQKESDNVFELFKENEQQLITLMEAQKEKGEQQNQNQINQNINKLETVVDSKEVERLKKQIANLLEETEELKEIINSKDEQNSALQGERIQLVRQVEELEIQVQKDSKPLRFASIMPGDRESNAGAMRMTYSNQNRNTFINRVSVAGKNLIQGRSSNARSSIFGQFRNSVIDKNQISRASLSGIPNKVMTTSSSSSMQSSASASGIYQSGDSEVSDINFEDFWKNQEPLNKLSGGGELQEPQLTKKSSGFGRSSTQFYKNFTAFDENELYARDFLGLRDNKKIFDVLEKYSDVDNPKEKRCFSDSIYRINNKNQKERRIMFVTSYNIFVLHPKNFKVIRKISLENIEKITFPNKSAYLCVIGIKQEYDYIIETYRRADFYMFLMLVVKERSLPPYQVIFSDNFVIKRRGAKKAVQLTEAGDNPLLDRYQASFKTAKKIGFLELKKSGLFSESWKEYFFVLSEIGLISFDSNEKPTESKPYLFIPICEALAVKDSAGAGKPFTIKIFYQNSSQDYILACKSIADQEEWLISIRKVIYKSINENASKDSAMKKQYLSPTMDSIEEQTEEN